MHFKRKRSPVFHALFFLMWACAFFGYAICGLKIPQHENPFYYRKKYVTGTTMRQMQEAATTEYGDHFNTSIAGMRRLAITNKGLEMQNQGLRFDFANNDELFC